MLLWMVQALRADGGLLQFRKSVESYSVSVFTAPVPLRVGPADVSILLQGRDGNAVLGSTVNIQLLDNAGHKIRVAATQAQATNKLMSATPVVFDRSGQWMVLVEIDAAGKALKVQGEISVAPARNAAATYWPYVAVVPAVMLLYVANQVLKRRRTSRRGIS